MNTSNGTNIVCMDESQTLNIPDNATKLVIEDGVRKMNVNFFPENDKIVTIKLPETVEIISYAAFTRCRGLVSIDLPESIEEIHESAFEFCDLCSVHLPSPIRSIEKNTFNGCTSLTSVKMSSCITCIADSAFQGCVSLKSMQYPSVSEDTDIDRQHTSLDLPSSLRVIADGAFSGCYSITSINLPPSICYVGIGIFHGCTSVVNTMIHSSIQNIDRYVVQRILHCIVMESPKVAQTPCTEDNCLPLHLLLMYGKVQFYKDHIDSIIQAAPWAMSALDPTFKMYPFLLAACTPKFNHEKGDMVDYFNNLSFDHLQQLETVYVLLCETPWLIYLLIS